MELSGLLIRIVILLSPGVLASSVYRKLRGRREHRLWEDGAEVLIFALGSYLLHWQLFGNHNAPNILDAFVDEAIPIDWGQVVVVTLIAFLVALAASATHYHRLFITVAKRIKVTNRTGDEDIWHYFNNSPEAAKNYVFVRDKSRSLVYYGHIIAFSDSGESRELILEDVDVFDEMTFEKRYSVQATYLNRDKYDLTIELPIFEPGNTSPGDNSDGQKQAE